MAETVAAVVVTFNRKILLGECLDALLAQTTPVDKIILIDNASTDGTSEFLADQGYLNNEKIDYLRLPENTGGAGGFYAGVKRGYEEGYDWLWLMDDDTECHRDALDHLLAVTKIRSLEVGFVCSKVVWSDGSVHRMNIPETARFVNNIAFNQYDEMAVSLVPSSSFVSCLVSSKAVRSVGLPIKDMFIWSDDVEYTYRITRANYLGVYARLSIAIHKTKENYNANIVEDKNNNLWKYKYGARNDVYTIRVNDGYIRSVLYVFKRLIIINSKILIYRRGGVFNALVINSCGAVSGLFYYPKIESVR